VPQALTNFSTPDAPITCVMLLETSTRGGSFTHQIPPYMVNAVNWSAAFIYQLKKEDWLALADFDMRAHYDVDFTQDKMAVRQYLSTMRVPGFSESNVFDAVIETLDRLQDVKGRKSILLLASGIDTFSKHTWDDTMKRLKQTDVTIFPVSVSQFLEVMRDDGRRPGGGNLTFLQADNQMREMGRITGGQSFFPRFDGEIPTIMQQVAAMLRSQYSLGYIPTNQSRDGKYRKIKVEAVGTDGKPLEVLNEKHKKLKLVIYARQGYTAPKGPVS
jgi:VWFA-related protein